MTLAFVFGAGSSRGALQAGALEVLFSAGIWPDLVVGSSIGSMNAAFIAQRLELGGAYRLQQLYRDTDLGDVFTGSGYKVLKNVLAGANHIFPADRMRDFLADHLAFDHFSQLPLPCFVTATDMDTGELQVFGADPRDKIVPSVLSSSAQIPLHPPVKVGGRLYADGGLKATLPLQVAVEQGATAIIALNLTTQLQSAQERNSPLDLILHGFDLLMQSQVELTRALIQAQTEVPVHMINLRPDTYRSFRDMDGMQDLIEQGRRQTRQAILEQGLRPGNRLAA